MNATDVYFIRVYRGRDIINGTWASTPKRAHDDGQVLARCFNADRYEVERVSPQEAHEILGRIICENNRRYARERLQSSAVAS